MYDDVGDFPIFRPLISAGKFKLASLTFTPEASRSVVLKWPLSGELDMYSLLKSFQTTEIFSVYILLEAVYHRLWK